MIYKFKKGDRFIYCGTSKKSHTGKVGTVLSTHFDEFLRVRYCVVKFDEANPIAVACKNMKRLLSDRLIGKNKHGKRV